MPAKNQKAALPTPVSPRNTAKYTNKDGSKYITVPKTQSDCSQPSTPTMATKPSRLPSSPPPPPPPNRASSLDTAIPSVNRKKQKRRQKALAKAAAATGDNCGHATTGSAPNPQSENHADGRDPAMSDDEAGQTQNGFSFSSLPNGHQTGATKGRKNKKKKKKQQRQQEAGGFRYTDDGEPSAAAGHVSSAFAARTAASHHQMGPRPSGMSRDKIWSTSNHEERERIKEFWLGLGEEERKSLVKVEKDAVLKKMKEQQKHTCSCTVCGRKRTAIEEELEGLYDAYYLELEQFANQGEGPPMLPPPSRDFLPHPPRRLPSRYALQQPSRGRIIEHVGEDYDEDDDDDDDENDENDVKHDNHDHDHDQGGGGGGIDNADDLEDEVDDDDEEREGEEEDEEVYSEDDVDDDEYSDDEPPEQFHNSYERDMTDFLTFGNSLQVKGTQLLESLLSAYGNMDLGGILTVADDLLKNDGKRFIEMMEQLAERRMAREEDAREHFSRGYGHPNGSYSNTHTHTHPPPPPPPPPPAVEGDDYEDEEDEEEDYEDSQDEEYEEEEVYSNPSTMPSKFHTECCCQDPMTEEQRMEEGRRMFQIFAARMFEQRVLSAYKEKVAKERQDKLLEELEEESRQVDQQRAKKAKNAQKKKDKAAQKKQALAEEKARKEADKAAEEAARLEAERKRIAEQKQKAEDKRKQKEAQKKAEEEARLRKEAERLRRIHEQREKQAEQERKAREAKEREKRLKEEQRQREKEARQQKEREAQERKEKQERDRREKEARAAKTLKEAQEAAHRAREARATAAHYRPSAQTSHHSQPNQAPKRGQAGQAGKAGQAHPVPLSIPTDATLPQHHLSNPAATYASPKIPIATPVIPKAPTPIRSRALPQQPQQQQQPQPQPQPQPQRQQKLKQQQPQQQQEAGSGPGGPIALASMAGQNAPPHPGTPVQVSPGPPSGLHDRRTSTSGGSVVSSRQLGQQQTPASPLSIHHQSKQLPVGHGHAPSYQIPSASLQPPPGLTPHRAPGFTSPMTPEPMFSLAFRPGGPNMMMPPPGINSPAGRGFPAPGPMPPPPGFGGTHSSSSVDQAFSMSQPFQPISKGSPIATSHHAHARQGSTGAFDSGCPVGTGLPSLPIGRPAPIGRPGSMSQGHSRDEDEDTKHLGSRVLVDDDEPLPTDNNNNILHHAPGSLRNQPPGPRAPGFAASPFIDAGFNSALSHNPWGPPSSTQHYAMGHPPPPPPPPPPPGFANPAWGPSPSMPSGFVGLGSPIPALGSIRTTSQPRHVAVRLMLCQACKDLAASGNSDANGYIDLSVVKSQIENQSGDMSITEQDLLNLCDTEGSSSNGGGTFDIKSSSNPGSASGPGSRSSKAFIRWAPDPSSDGSGGQGYRPVGAPGEIGSPLSGHASLRGF
ncbi:hypothetical protein E4U58_003238 [Claviceps cyperi]|nr:hypothetical protein E4U58_003238 [Claviceps cyperi]